MFRGFMPSMGMKDNAELLKLAREIDPPKRAVEMNNEIEKDKEVVYEEEFRFWRTTLGSVVARHLPLMTVPQMKELIKKIKEGAVEIKFIDYQK